MFNTCTVCTSFMRILAIDPGYDRCGVAVVEKFHPRDTVVYSTCLTTNKKDTVHTRIHHIGARIREFMQVFQPDAVAVESLFLSNNQKTAMAVAEVKGVIGFLATDANIPLYEFTPLQIKIAITGDGRAPKERIDMMIPRLTDFDRAAKLAEYGGNSSGIDDEIDAVAVGVTALVSIRL